jgi:hypothetical protein
VKSGVLKEVKPSKIEPVDRLFLYIEYENAYYLGCLLLDHYAFCRQMTDLFQRCYDRPLPEIGELFGGRDHTTVLHAVRKIGGQRSNNGELNHALHVLEQTLKG